MQKLSDLVERIHIGLITSSLNAVGVLIIFLLALPLICAGLRERPLAAPVPIEVESASMIQTLPSCRWTSTPSMTGSA
jgi:hypothetical protein